MSRSHRSTIAFASSLLALAVAAYPATSGAADAPLLGKLARLSDARTPAKRRATIVLTGAAIDLTAADPTTGGATLALASTATSYRSTRRASGDPSPRPRRTPPPPTPARTP